MAAADVVLAALALLYIFLCPYTKVEESFNLQVRARPHPRAAVRSGTLTGAAAAQAIHDMLFHGRDLDSVRARAPRPHTDTHRSAVCNGRFTYAESYPRTGRWSPV
jgi:hypothetical protein